MMVAMGEGGAAQAGQPEPDRTHAREKGVDQVSLSQAPRDG
jgi:hypothetical protein